MMRLAHDSVVAAALFIGIAGCGQAPSIPSGQIEGADRPALDESWDVVLHISEAGLPLIRIAAPHMERYDDPDSVFTLLDSDPESGQPPVRAVFFDSIGVESASLAASTVRFDEDGERLIASGSVRVQARSGRRLEAETLHWNQAERRIMVPGFVYLETEDEKIRGFDLDADEDLDHYVIKRITGTVVIREDRE